MYLTSSKWPGPSLIFLYVALRKNSLDTPALEHQLDGNRWKNQVTSEQVYVELYFQANCQIKD